MAATSAAGCVTAFDLSAAAAQAVILVVFAVCAVFAFLAFGHFWSTMLFE
jgi:hypothetical protein